MLALAGDHSEPGAVDTAFDTGSSLSLSPLRPNRTKANTANIPADLRTTLSLIFQGFFFVVLFGQDEGGNAGVLSVNAPNSGGPAVVQVGGTVITDELWIADASVHGSYPLQVLPPDIGATAAVDGDTVSGSGVFYEDRSLTETRQSGGPYETGVVEGTFSVTCPGG
jgi:hypothetical protein